MILNKKVLQFRLFKKIDNENLKKGKLTYVKFIEQDIKDLKRISN